MLQEYTAFSDLLCSIRWPLWVKTWWAMYTFALIWKNTSHRRPERLYLWKIHVLDVSATRKCWHTPTEQDARCYFTGVERALVCLSSSSHSSVGTGFDSASKHCDKWVRCHKHSGYVLQNGWKFASLHSEIIRINLISTDADSLVLW